MISTQEVQADFSDFIRQVADTYRKLSKVIIADIVCAKGSYEDQIEIISKLYNIDFKKSLQYLEQWKEQISALPILEKK
jgi:DNA-binding transcriptional regulator YbjK